MTICSYARILMALVMRQVIAFALRGSQDRARPKTCFLCEQPGHFKKNCHAGRRVGSQSRQNPGTWAKCWNGGLTKECHSKIGNPLPILGNRRRSQTWAPKMQVNEQWADQILPSDSFLKETFHCPRPYLMYHRKCWTGPLCLRPGDRDPTD